MLKLFGKIPSKNKIAEYRQFMRVVSIIKKMVEKNDENGIILSGIEYEHKKGFLIDNDSSWNGEIDIILILSSKLIIYELKAKEITIRFGTTDSRNWKWHYNSNPDKCNSDSFFIQASKQRAYFLREYLNNFKKSYKIPEPNHFVVDSRIILKNGSDFTKFFFKPPANYDMKKFENNILEKIIDKSDKDFMISAYSEESEKIGFNRLRKLEILEYENLCNIIKKYKISLKTANWFKILTEEQIEQDFMAIPEKTDEIFISLNDILKIPEDLNLDEIDMQITEQLK